MGAMGRCKKLVFMLLFFAADLFSDKAADLLYIGSGINNILRPGKYSCEFRVEYKSHLKYWYFRPLIGVSYTTNSQLYACLGFGLDFYPKSYLVISPTFAAGYYNKGNGKDLGFPIEFRTGIELSYRFKDLSRLGFHFSHTSNASLGNKNPGLETILLFYAFPLSKK